MPEFSVMFVFISTWFFVSITPGLCMTLAMTLGMRLGVRLTLWMMLGEVIGVSLVASLAVLGVAGLMLHYPSLFIWFKWIGGAYLCYLGLKMWFSKNNGASKELDTHSITPSTLVAQGFITAVANPKGWAFMISILPPFISSEKSLIIQFSVLLGIIVLCELTCMLIYASGGSSLRQLLKNDSNLIWLNRVAGTLLAGVGVWLATT